MAANKFTMALRRLKAVATKEVRQLSRDRVTFGMIVGVPLMQIILFGYAINYDVRNLATVVQDDANSSMSRELVAQLKATQVVHVRYTTNSSDELAKLMREGRASMAVVIPKDFERRLQGDTRPVVQILVDGSQPQLAVVAAGIAAMPMLTRHGEGPYSGGKRMAPRRIEIRTLYNPEKRTAVQIVPALIGVILTMTMVLFTSGAIVRERERGNLELLIATPLSSLELMVGKLLPYVAIGLIQTTIILIVGAWLFSVPIVEDSSTCTRRRWCSSLPRWDSDCSSPHWRKRSSRRSSSHSSPCCRRSCCQGSCFRSKACPRRRSGSRSCCRSRIST